MQDKCQKQLDSWKETVLHPHGRGQQEVLPWKQPRSVQPGVAVDSSTALLRGAERPCPAPGAVQDLCSVLSTDSHSNAEPLCKIILHVFSSHLCYAWPSDLVPF